MGRLVVMTLFLLVTCKAFILDYNYLIHNFEQDCKTKGTNDPTVQLQYIRQNLTHDGTLIDKRTWLMRYFERLDMWQPGGPIVIFVGGNHAASPTYLMAGLAFTFAKEINAAMYMTEHRFYGKSKPFDDLNDIRHLKYLHFNESLGDLAYFINHLKKQPKFQNSKVVLFGGFYGGSLAAWLQSSNPNLVNAVYTSGAPLRAQFDFSEYLEALGKTFATYGGELCYESIKRSFDYYDSLLRKQSGIEYIKWILNICHKSDLRKEENKFFLFTILISEYARIVHFGTPVGIEQFCQHKLNTADKERGLLRCDENTAGACIYPDLEANLNKMKENTDNKMWYYQLCTQFGFAITTTSHDQIFTRNLPLQAFVNICQKLFGKQITYSSLTTGISLTNSLVGGDFGRADNRVLYVHGDMDPWRRLSVGTDWRRANNTEFLISGSSHMHDLWCDRFNDSDELRQARTNAKIQLNQWINEDVEQTTFYVTNDYTSSSFKYEYDI